MTVGHYAKIIPARTDQELMRSSWGQFVRVKDRYILYNCQLITLDSKWGVKLLSFQGQGIKKM